MACWVTTCRPAAIPLALSACLRSNGQALPLDDAAWPACLPFATPKLLVQVHGLCMNDLQWRQQGHDHGAQLAAEHGYTPVHLHYNSGLSIASNGQAFAQLLQQLLARWPVPVETLCHPRSQHGRLGGTCGDSARQS